MPKKEDIKDAIIEKIKQAIQYDLSLPSKDSISTHIPPNVIFAIFKSFKIM